MNTYETLFITKPDLTEEAEQAIVDVLAALVPAGGGTMIANERMGRRRLAYPINKVEEGVYTRFLYDSNSPVAEEIERRVRLSDHVLRSLTVRLRDDWAEDSKKQAVIDAERRIQDAIDAKAKEEADALEAIAKAEADALAAAELAANPPASSDADDNSAAGVESATPVLAAKPIKAKAEVKDSTPEAESADGTDEDK